MAEPERYSPRPETPPPPLSTRSSDSAVMAVALALCVIVAGGVFFRGRPRTLPPQVDAAAPASASVSREKPGSCRPYSVFAARLSDRSVPDEELREDAACLCATAGGFTVFRTSGLTRAHVLSSCPAGSAPFPFEPDAKIWKGDWIDTPGHTACGCAIDARGEKFTDALR